MRAPNLRLLGASSSSPGQTMDDLSEAHMKEIIARAETFAQKAADYYEEC